MRRNFISIFFRTTFLAWASFSVPVEHHRSKPSCGHWRDQGLHSRLLPQNAPLRRCLPRCLHHEQELEEEQGLEEGQGQQQEQEQEQKQAQGGTLALF